MKWCGRFLPSGRPCLLDADAHLHFPEWMHDGTPQSLAMLNEWWPKRRAARGRANTLRMQTNTGDR